MAKLLSLDDRMQIEKYLTLGLSIYKISKELGYADSTIRDEVKNNHAHGTYDGKVAHSKSWERRHRPKRYKAAEMHSASLIAIKKRMMVTKSKKCSYCHGVGQKTLQTAESPKLPLYVTCIICDGTGEVGR